MKKMTIGITALAVCLITVNCQKPGGRSGMPLIAVQGNRFVDANGKQVIFRGLDFSDLDKLESEGHWSEAHFAEARAWGANIVRLAVHPKWWRDRGHENYLALLDEGIDWAEKLQLYVIIDWHSIGNLKDELFFGDIYQTSQEETFEFWRTVAMRYKNRPHVAFYELYNEPTFYNEQLGTLTWNDLKVLWEALIDTIYAIDDTVIPLVAGLDWGYSLAEVIQNPVERPNVGYVTHPYPQKVDQPWEPKWERDFGHVADRYPVVATEFGFVLADEKGAHIPCISDETYGKHIVNYFTKKGISWTVWCFDPDWAPVLIVDWDYSLSTQGKFFKNVLLNRQYSFSDTEE